MSTPEQEIAALKEEIAEYSTKLNTAGISEERFITIANMITETTKTLNRLLDAQAAAAGNAPPVTHFVSCAPLLLFLYRHVLSLYMYF
jgi:hypothetical protein